MIRKKMIILPQLYNADGNISKTWFVYYSVRDPRSGKMIRFKIFKEIGKTNDSDIRSLVAQKIIEEYARKLRAGWSPFSDDENVIYDDNLEYDNITRIYGKKRIQNKTIRYWSNKYLDWKKGEIDNDGTLPTYQSKLRIFTNWIDAYYEPGNDISFISNQVIVKFFTWLISDQQRSRKTVGDYRYILGTMFEWFVAQKAIISNPVHDLPPCNTICDMAPYPIHEMDIEAFKQELVHDPQLWLAVQFQYYCALRPGKELRMLKIKNIDFARGQVTINRTIAKTKTTRTMVIPREFLVELREQNLMNFDHDFYVFSLNGKPGKTLLGKNNLRFRFNAIRKKLNMPIEYKFYSWKHTGGVQASLAGIPDSHIQRQMGHTSIETTSRYLRRMTGFQSDYLKNQYPKL